MTQEMKDVIYSKDKHIVLQAYAGCVDKDTEYFDGDRWKKISEYALGDKVLQYTKDGAGMLVYPERYIDEPCDTFIKIKTKFSDMMLSEDHRFVYLDTSHGVKKENLIVKSADQVYTRHHKTKSGFMGKVITDFRFESNKVVDIDEDILRLTIAICADGTIRGNDNVRMNLKKQRKKDRLEHLLSKCKIDYKKESWNPKDSEYANYIFKLEGIKKRIPKEWVYLKDNLKKIVIEECVLWDGSTPSGKSTQYFSTNKEDIDTIQFIAHSVGYKANIYVDDRLGEIQISSNGEQYVRKSICYQLTFDNNPLVGLSNRHSSKSETMKKIHVEGGRKYCFTVPSGFLILRRNGKIFVTGNCGKSHTLLEYVKEHPNENILFVVYNKELQVDFQKRVSEAGLRNCKVSTIHSLAYADYLRRGLPKKRLKNISLLEMKKLLDKNLEYKDLSKIKFYFDRFLCSSCDTVFEMETIDRGDKVYFKYVDKLWKWYSGDSDEMPHNVYLKLFQLSKPKLNCQTLLYDEFNDVNACMVSIVSSNLEKKIVVVGDRRQNINTFNHTVDGIGVMLDVFGFKEYRLTLSFRVSEDVASLSSKYLSYMYDEKIEFHGNNSTKFGKIELLNATKENQAVLLSRTKLGGLTEVLEVIDKDKSKKIYYVGGLEGFGINEIEKLLNFKGNIYIANERYHINDLRKMLKDGLVDPEISRIVSIYSFAQKDENCIELFKATETKNREEADIIVQTAHSSKGATMTNVKLGRDFPKIEDMKKLIKTYENECKYRYGLTLGEANLLYVAITRSNGILDIGASMNRNEKIKTEDKIEGVNEVMSLLRVKEVKKLDTPLKKRSF